MMNMLCQAPMTFFLFDIFGVSALLLSGAKVITPSDGGEYIKRLSAPGPIELATGKVAPADYSCCALIRLLEALYHTQQSSSCRHEESCVSPRRRRMLAHALRHHRPGSGEALAIYLGWMLHLLPKSLGV